MVVSIKFITLPLGRDINYLFGSFVLLNETVYVETKWKTVLLFQISWYVIKLLKLMFNYSILYK